MSGKGKSGSSYIRHQGVSIDVKSCDMVSGVISVRVTEDFVLPGGFHKSIACDKTILVETEVIEEETETEEIWPQEEEV